MKSERKVVLGATGRGVGRLAPGARRRGLVRRSIVAEYQALALDPAMDAAKLSELIAADERRQARSAAQAFALDLAEVAAELPVVAQNGEIRVGDEVLATYALWEDLNEAIRPVLHRWGFVLSFSVDSSPGEIRVVARLMHRSGHVETTSLTLPPDPGVERNRVQAIGSSVSYGKRYTACALLNLTSRGEDDDGICTGPLVDAEQLSALEAGLLESGANRLRFLNYLGLPTLAALPAERFEDAMAALQARNVESAA